VSVFGFAQTLGSSKPDSGSVKVIAAAAWAHETSFVKVHSDTRRGLVLSFCLSIFRLITNQLGSVQKMKLHKGRKNCVIFENDAEVVWNQPKFHLSAVVLKDSKFNAGHYISSILVSLLEILAPYQDDPRWHFAIDTDNTRLCSVKTTTQFVSYNSLGWTHHSPYSPDLSSQTSGVSDIWKEYFKGVHSTNLMNFCSRSRKCWGESIARLWMRYFKNGWSDWENILMEMVNMLSDV
jgi:hypothetical protein